MHLTSIIGVLISLTHILSRSYKLWEIGNVCISPFGMANPIPLTAASVMGLVLNMQYTSLHVTPFMTQTRFFSLRTHSRKDIYLLSHLCFCLYRSCISENFVVLRVSVRNPWGLPEFKKNKLHS